MNSENFHEYVKNPSMLHQVSYQELKSLVLQYPYSPNLRYLLLLKSLLDQSKDFDKNQVLASLSSPDRKKLRQLVKQYSRLREIQENYSLGDDYLELKDLSVLEDLLDAPMVEDIAPAKENGMAGAAVPPPPAASLEDLDEEIEEESDLSFLSNLGIDQEELHTSGMTGTVAPVVVEAAPEGESEVPVLEELLETETEDDQRAVSQETTVEVLPEPPTVTHAAAEIPLEITNEPEVQPTPKPRSSFNSWLKQFTPPKAGVLTGDLKDISLNSRTAPPPAPIVAADAKQIAEHSVEEDDEIASETLALLLEKQKLFGKAISMYERLSLKFSEKSGLFAAKIEELNKKI